MRDPATTSRPSTRRLLLALALFAGLAGLAGWLLRADPPTAGREACGISVRLERDGAPLSDAAVADSVLSDARASLADAPLATELDEAVATSLREAVRRAQSQGLPAAHGAALARLRPDEVQCVWEDRAWDARMPVDGREVQRDSLSAKSPPADLRAGVRVHVRVSAQIAEWPRGEGYLPHPELLLAQARSEYFTPEDGLATFARALADELALRAAARIRLAAEARGLAASVRAPQP